MTATQDTPALFDEDFADGLAIGERWQYVEAPGYVSDDGVVSPTPAGISIAPAARNPRTGEPMFTKEADGFAGHLKWLAFTTEAFTTDGGPLRVRFRADARCFGMAEHPYGSAVTDPDTDIRLGSATLNVLDFASGLVFDFWLNNSFIVPFYERLRPPGTPEDYGAFTMFTNPIPREPGTVHDLAIVLDAAAGTARWEVDGAVVATVEQVGLAPADWTTVLSHGGTPQPATANHVQIGLGLMTLLDASWPPATDGLVDIGAELEHPAGFATDGPSLFGQGVRLDVERIVVERA